MAAVLIEHLQTKPVLSHCRLAPSKASPAHWVLWRIRVPKSSPESCISKARTTNLWVLCGILQRQRRHLYYCFWRWRKISIRPPSGEYFSDKRVPVLLYPLGTKRFPMGLITPTKPSSETASGTGTWSVTDSEARLQVKMVWLASMSQLVMSIVSAFGCWKPATPLRIFVQRGEEMYHGLDRSTEKACWVGVKLKYWVSFPPWT